MAMQHDTDLNPTSEAELLHQQQEEELARRIRREVRRVQRGEAQEEMAAEEAEEAEQRARQEALAERERQKSKNPLRGLITGNILRQEWLTVHYRYPLLIAGVFLLSIVVIFWSLRLDMKLSHTEREVQLLRERSIRLREQLYKFTSHQAVVEELQRRGIPLQEPRRTKEVVED
jgi:hypothetical protein